MRFCFQRDADVYVGSKVIVEGRMAFATLGYAGWRERPHLGGGLLKQERRLDGLPFCTLIALWGHGGDHPWGDAD